jgi:DNA-directed RNA polymerase specialized sigma24 family protein
MRNTSDLDQALTSEALKSIKKIIRAKFTIPCEKYGVDIEDFYQNIFTIAYKRGTFDSKKSSAITYFYWLARTELSHIKEANVRRPVYGIPIYDEAGKIAISLEDNSPSIHPEKMHLDNAERETLQERLAEYFEISIYNIKRLLDAEPKDIVQTAKRISADEGFDQKEAECFMTKIKKARTAGGFKR